jgi:branched-chain amino acid transport system substrate-binding protein
MEGKTMKKEQSVAILLVVAMLVVAVAACAPTQAPEEAAKDSIKICFFAPVTSTSAESAKDMADGFQMFWDEHGQEIAGRPVEIFYEDDAGDPDVALSKARLCVEQREADMLAGLLFAHTGLSVAEYVKEVEIPTFFQVVSADDLTQRTPVDTLVRIAGWTSSQVHHPFGEWVYDNTECRRVYTIGSDYAFGQEVVGGFVNTFTDKGGEVVDQIWNPIGEADFSSYLATMQAAGPDCVFSLQVGAAATRFLQAYSDFGLKDTIPLYAGEVQTDQSVLRGVEPQEAAVGFISAGHFAEGRDSPETKAFVEKYDGLYGKLPGYYAPVSYTAAKWIAQALEDVDGNVDDKEAFLAAIRAVEFADTPMGPLKLDEYDNPIQNIYIREVVMRDDGRVWNVVKEVIPGVSQFWTYDPEEFLKQPVYSRDYQGVDWP